MKNGASVFLQYSRILGKEVIKALKDNGFDAEYFDTVEEAKQDLIGMIPDNASVGFGGSTTIEDMDLQQILLNKGCVLYDHSKGVTPEEKLELRRLQLQSDVFLTSSNALTRDGKLYNVDATGNRVAAMVFGPRQVVIVVGINKIVADIEAARKRVQTVAAPLNNLKIKTSNPCTKTGICMDCQNNQRICRIETVLHKKPSATVVKVIIVGEKMGF